MRDEPCKQVRGAVSSREWGPCTNRALIIADKDEVLPTTSVLARPAFADGCCRHFYMERTHWKELRSTIQRSESWACPSVVEFRGLLLLVAGHVSMTGTSPLMTALLLEVLPGPFCPPCLGLQVSSLLLGRWHRPSLCPLNNQEHCSPGGSNMVLFGCIFEKYLWLLLGARNKEITTHVALFKGASSVLSLAACDGCVDWMPPPQ